MRNEVYIIIFLVIPLGVPDSLAQTKDDKKQYRFGLLRQFDSVSFLKDKEGKNVYDKLKYISIGEASHLSFGGSYRTQFEYFNNEGFVEGTSDGWWLNRFLLHTYLYLGEHWQFYAEMASSSVLSKENPSPVDRDEAALMQAFVNFTEGNWTVQVGRINPVFGTGRIIELREGPNVRRYFDGISLTYTSSQLKIKPFYYQPVDIDPFGFDNDILDGDESIFGLYNTWENSTKTQNLEVYYMGRFVDAFRYQIGVEEEKRHSLGVRYYGSWGNLLFNNEALYQFGSFGEQDISAWTASTKLNYILKAAHNEWDFGLKAEYISGDKDTSDDRLNTFNALYPRGAYFGRVAQFGPSNLIDIHPSITLFSGKWFFMMDYVAFWRASDEDAIYGAGLNLAFPDTNDSKFIGHQYGAVVNFTPNTFMSFEVEANYITAGNFLEESNLDNNLFHFVATAEFKL